MLCDEMGLGKTIQTIKFIECILDLNRSSKILIVCPLSLLEHWSTEFSKFAPLLSCKVYMGNKDERAKLRSALVASTFSVLITSYEACLNDELFFARFSWSLLIVDEGHRLKNSSSLLYQMLSQNIKGFRFILTGTPIQNNLDELYNLLHFVAPKIFLMETKAEFIKIYSRIDSAVIYVTFGWYYLHIYIYISVYFSFY
ncbi:unnamed protein product [Protopolystoma xenopodis]|uniref:Helicase ATP-binding domain-containing protein n=1 Tax=Protopolystoma xenopodis TaxID=117903 RepID=A0A3S5A7L1_9PLAT|nr:unnamed protein product [Protopolystoma xenopodis]